MFSKKNNYEKNDVLLIVGNRGSGKTLLSALIVGLNMEKTFYANFYIDSPNCHYFDSVNELIELIGKYGAGCVIIDEAQKLLNSRAFNSKLNNAMVKFVVESRKYQVDLILIGQVFEGIDKQIRQQIDYLFDMQQITYSGVMKLNCLSKKRYGDNFRSVGFYSIVEPLKVLINCGVSYDTKENVNLNI